MCIRDIFQLSAGACLVCLLFCGVHKRAVSTFCCRLCSTQRLDLLFLTKCMHLEYAGIVRCVESRIAV